MSDYLKGPNGEWVYAPSFDLGVKEGIIEARRRVDAMAVNLKGGEQVGEIIGAVLRTLDNAYDEECSGFGRSGEPIPMRIPCPSCGKLHVDKGMYATRVHHTHACQFCGEVWRNAIVPTVGVQFLPGFLNEEKDDG